jgi:hypothetical protein
MIIEFSESDLLQSKLVPPAWYRVLIEKVEDKLSKDSNSTNTWLRGKILYNADDGSKEYAGVPAPFPWLFNSKAPWAAVGFVNAMGIEVKPGVRVNLQNAEGKEVDMFIENDLYEGVMKNVTRHKYRTPKEVAA